MEDYLAELNDSQRQAVEYIDGASLVIAGAGSGKTRVLTYKIVHLLRSGYQPYQLLALTFTNKAAREMKERIATLVTAATLSQLWVGTFHAIFARILRANAPLIGYTSDFTIYDTSDSRSLLKFIIKEMQLDDKMYKVNLVQAVISNAKNALITPSMYAVNKALQEADYKSKRPLIGEIYRRYQAKCFMAKAMDFDDLLLYTNILFRDHPDLLQSYRERFRFVLVDEYQDTNFAQHLIVNQLTKEHQRLCVVGDDAQSIYSFRGANIDNILNLKDNFTHFRIFKLEQNYRSTQNIVNAANSLIEKNRQQINKRVFSHNPPGDKIQLIGAYSDYEETRIIAGKIAELRMRQSAPYADFAILYRTNSQSRLFEEALRERNIPYRIYGGQSFYQRKGIKGAIAYFRLILNHGDEEALKRIINYPARGIGDTTLNKVLTHAQVHHVSAWEVIEDPLAYNLPVNAGTAAKLRNFAQLITQLTEQIATKHAADAADLILRRSGLVADVHSEQSPEYVSKQENINELNNAIIAFVRVRQEEGNEDTSLSQFLTEASLATDQDQDQEGESRDEVMLMTVHASKGLEFRNVCIVGVEEGLFPSSMTQERPGEVEEERRLLYVAITRAKEVCIISFARSRYRNGAPVSMPPSRFLQDIDPQFMHLPDSMLSRPARNIPLPREKTSPPSIPSAGYTRLDKAMGKPATQSPHEPFDVGSVLQHDRFGVGHILDISGEGENRRIVVRFDNVGEKTLLLKFAKFTLLKK